MSTDALRTRPRLPLRGEMLVVRLAGESRPLGHGMVTRASMGRVDVQMADGAWMIVEDWAWGGARTVHARTVHFTAPE